MHGVFANTIIPAQPGSTDESGVIVSRFGDRLSVSGREWFAADDSADCPFWLFG
jgi:hypothetical protein